MTKDYAHHNIEASKRKGKLMKRQLPYDDNTDRELFDNDFHTASMSDCTGLIPTAPLDNNEIKSYSDIFDIPLPNHQNNRRDIMNDQNRKDNQNKKDDLNRKDDRNNNNNRYGN